MGIGRLTGENRTVEATKKAILCPLLEVNMCGAKQGCFNITGGPDLCLFEAQELLQIVLELAKDDVYIIFGTLLYEELGDEVVVTVIATGIEEEDQRRETTRRPALLYRNTDVTQCNGSYRPTSGGHEQSLDVAPKNDDPFGNWDCWREPSKRQTPRLDDMNNVKKKDFDISENVTKLDELGTDDVPPSFKQRRRV